MAEPMVIVLLGADLDRLDAALGEELRVEPERTHRFACVSSENGITVWSPNTAEAGRALTAGVRLSRWVDGHVVADFTFEPGGEPGGLDAALLLASPAPHP